ncbi:putative sugar phosphate/phosphate translocator [Hibiscus syriacus]|uniref:Sugar phosphate/phosphate translocator n=1 Tax=Hibiscus syriacus TaxID=106335 RepID=A0A6A2ZEA8_HIBSY|nr:putative sugar phosphate/phosphate translocator [Hibiscus syriacus]
MCHMSACAFLSYISVVFMKLVPSQPIKSRPQFLKIAALSVVFCGSVVGGNISLRYLPVSFNQAVGATTPFFTALFAYLMTFKREAWFTYAALVPVVAGVVIASGGEPGFHWFGFIMCISATAARAFKSFFRAFCFLLKAPTKSEHIVFVLPFVSPEKWGVPVEKLNSMNLLLYMSPIAVLVLVPAVLGNAKGAVAVVISILLFRNPVTVMGIGGYTITVLGVVAYGEAKLKFKGQILGDCSMGEGCISCLVLDAIFLCNLALNLGMHWRITPTIKLTDLTRCKIPTVASSEAQCWQMFQDSTVASKGSNRADGVILWDYHYLCQARAESS